MAEVRSSDLEDIKRRLDQIESEVRPLLAWVRGDMAGSAGAQARIDRLEDSMVDVKAGLSDIRATLQRAEKRERDRAEAEAVRAAEARTTRRVGVAILALVGVQNLDMLWTWLIEAFPMLLR